MKGFSSGVRFERLYQKDSGYCRCGSLWRAEIVRMHCCNPGQTNAIPRHQPPQSARIWPCGRIGLPADANLLFAPTELKRKVVNPDRVGSEAAPRP